MPWRDALYVLIFEHEPLGAVATSSRRCERWSAADTARAG
jgi:hypothetical protein